ncbi:hypothetical protein HHK36_010296 [Tetracentron sinense]|uniref:Calmodulin-lysine N-methyltransferase n=1 Tax=Tetracentron sinense TaxID=13715 RepID=A0A835DJ39_TETSI|nr:hypothetical protein HHK36_010296 [Tetracentron sinense]
MQRSDYRPKGKEEGLTEAVSRKQRGHSRRRKKSRTADRRSKRILELGSGYGLAGLVIAASTDALEVVISDGNPQVVDCILRFDIQHNINANSGAFGDTKVKPMTLHWNQNEVSNISNTFDIIVASDCTFFKEFHEGLARIVKSSPKYSGASEAIFFSPKRGNSLDKFLEEIKRIGMHFRTIESSVIRSL